MTGKRPLIFLLIFIIMLSMCSCNKEATVEPGASEPDNTITAAPSQTSGGTESTPVPSGTGMTDSMTPGLSSTAEQTATMRETTAGTSYGGGNTTVRKTATPAATAARTTAAPTRTPTKTTAKAPVETPFKVGNSNYNTYKNPSVPKGAYQAKTIYRLSEPSFPTVLTLTTLQGLAANTGSGQILITAGAYSQYSKYIQEDYGVTISTKDPNGSNWTTWKLVELFKDKIAGYILCDDTKGSISQRIAISISKQLNAIAVPAKLESNAKNLGLKRVADVTNMTDAQFRSSSYFKNISRDFAFEQSTDVFPKLADYAAMSGAYYNFYSGNSESAHKSMYNFLNSGGLVFGYNNTLGEKPTVNSFSQLNLSMVPADHAHNISTLSGFRLESIKQKTTQVSSSVPTSNRHTVCFVMSDGDNMQWFLGDYATSNKWYASSKRGNFNMGWGIPPTAIDLSAPMVKYYYGNMTSKDNFIAELSGLGYTFPSKWTDKTALESMAAKVSDYMKRLDTGILEILDDNAFKTSNFDPFTKQSGIDSIFYIDYDKYNRHDGQILWSNNKPVISARYRLWAGPSDGGVSTIANAINSASKDPKKAGAYSFVIVHAWSGLSGGSLKEGGNTMDAVEAVIKSLGSNVDVVTPAEFVNRVVKNHPT